MTVPHPPKILSIIICLSFQTYSLTINTNNSTVVVVSLTSLITRKLLLTSPSTIVIRSVRNVLLCNPEICNNKKTMNWSRSEWGDKKLCLWWLNLVKWRSCAAKKFRASKSQNSPLVMNTTFTQWRKVQTTPLVINTLTICTPAPCFVCQSLKLEEVAIEAVEAHACDN